MDMDLPKWIIDLERQRHDMLFGRIPLELIISQGSVAKVNVTKQKQVKFRNNEEAKIYILDYLNAKIQDSSGTTTFSVIHKDGKISQINEFEQIELNYPI